MQFNLEWVFVILTLVEGVSRGKFSEEVQKVESVIRRRFTLGSSIVESRLKDELLKMEFAQTSIDRAIYQLVAKEVLAYEEKRVKIKRVKQ